MPPPLQQLWPNRQGRKRADQPGLSAGRPLNVTAHIVVPEAAVAAAWYVRAFGAKELSRIPLPGGRVLASRLSFGATLVHVGSEFPDMGILSPLSIGGTATALQIDTDDVDALWARALSEGARVHYPLSDAFWGERHGQLIDPFDHRWNLAEQLRDVPQPELVAAAARAFGGFSSSG